jgi:ATP-dependent RNA helicase RhlE
MFSSLGLSPAACASLARLGYVTPTPIQTEAIPRVLSGVDLLARAQTGTGKTAAFGLPLIERLLTRRSESRPRVRGLVLVPTRELALQVHDSLAAYASSTPIRVAAIFGGVSMSRQVDVLRRGVDVVVATPGRLLDHLQRRTVELTGVEVLVLDEADRMLDMGFLPALRRVVAAVPRNRQTLLFSATLADDVLDIAKAFTREPVRVDVSPRQVVATTVTHHVHEVAVARKREVLTHILTQEGIGQALVFCRTKRGANRVGEELGQRGVRADVIHGNKSQGARTRALHGFKSGQVRVLVATDIAARGLDIAQLPLVVNYDLPMVPEDYVHRVGRTGRAGQPGRAVSLVSADEAGLLKEIQRVVASPLERVAAPVVTGSKTALPVADLGPVHDRRVRRPDASGRKAAPRRPSPHRGAGRRSERPHAHRGARPTPV